MFALRDRARNRGAGPRMSRASVAERTKLSVFVARGIVRRLLGRVTTNPIVNWLFSFGKPDRLVIAPQDLRTTDATRASEIYSGRFVLPERSSSAIRARRSRSRLPRRNGPPRCSASAGAPPARRASAITRANARALVDEWITLNRSRASVAWRPDVVARRIISWLCQAPLVLDDADAAFYRRFMRSLTRQVRHLRHTAGEARDGVPRLQAVIALTYAASAWRGSSATCGGEQTTQRRIAAADPP